MATEVQHSPDSDADQWSKMVSGEETRIVNGGRVTYLGESWTLSYVLQWKSRDRSASGGNRPQFSPEPGLHVGVPFGDQDSPSQRSELASVVMPEDHLPRDTQEALITAYCDHNHSLYPIISQQYFRTALFSRTISPLLLCSVLYAGALHVPDSVVYRAKYESRQACLTDLYSRAKRLFFGDDAEDQLAKVQAAFLLHNMWQGPNSTMDPWTWLGMAIRLAQNMGMHRTTAKSALKPEDRKLWRKIWWSLYVRDYPVYISHLLRVHAPNQNKMS